MQIGKRIRNFRERLKLTQEKLGELIGMDANNISRIERGESTPSLETLLKLCNGLKITPNDILMFEYKASKIELREEISELLIDCNTEQYTKIIEYICFLKQQSK